MTPKVEEVEAGGEEGEEEEEEEEGRADRPASSLCLLLEHRL